MGKLKLSYKTKVKLFNAQLAFAIIGTVFTAGLAITGAVCTTKASKKIDNYVKDFQETDVYLEQYKADNAENERAYGEGEITRKKYNENIEYYDSDEYAKDLLKSTEDPTYSAILKSKNIYNNMMWSALGIAGAVFVDCILTVSQAFLLDSQSEDEEKKLTLEAEEKEKRMIDSLPFDSENYEQAKF